MAREQSLKLSRCSRCNKGAGGGLPVEWVHYLLVKQETERDRPVYLSHAADISDSDLHCSNFLLARQLLLVSASCYLEDPSYQLLEGVLPTIN